MSKEEKVEEKNAASLYPLKEKILNENGESVVYVDYRDRFLKV
jgi:hypothetical protein